MSPGEILETIGLGASPIGELRVAIPRAIIGHDAGWFEVYWWAVLGNLVSVVLLVLFLDPVSRLLAVFPNPAGRFLQWRARRLRERQGRSIERWGVWALMAFVAVPLPLTGAWTGCLLAWAVGMPRSRAFPAVAAGVLLAGVIVTALVQLSINFPFVES